MKRALILWLIALQGMLFAGNVKEPFKVKAVRLKKGNISEFVHVYGRVITSKMGYVISPMPGKLMKYTKKEGSFFKKDEPVAYVERTIPGVKTKPLVVKAPFDGILAVTYVHEGDMVSQTKPLALFYSKTLYIEADVTQDILKKVRRNAPCILGPRGEKGKGVVESVSYGVDPLTTMGKIRIRVTNYRGILPGEPVGVSISTKISQNTYIVPLSAIVKRDGRTFVFAYENGIAKQIEVKVGVMSGDRVEIKGNGLRENMMVITRGAAGLYNNAPVELVK